MQLIRCHDIRDHAPVVLRIAGGFPSAAEKKHEKLIRDSHRRAMLVQWGTNSMAKRWKGRQQRPGAPPVRVDGQRLEEAAGPHHHEHAVPPAKHQGLDRGHFRRVQYKVESKLGKTLVGSGRAYAIKVREISKEAAAKLGPPHVYLMTALTNGLKKQEIGGEPREVRKNSEVLPRPVQKALSSHAFPPPRDGELVPEAVRPEIFTRASTKRRTGAGARAVVGANRQQLQEQKEDIRIPWEELATATNSMRSLRRRSCT